MDMEAVARRVRVHAPRAGTGPGVHRRLSWLSALEAGIVHLFFFIQLQAVSVSAEMKHLRCPHRCSRSHCVIGHRGTGRAVRVFVFDLGLRCDIENHSRTTLPWSLCQMDAGRGRVERGRKGRHTGTS